MNYLIIGLSNFGISLATRLTSMGHNVCAVDANMHLVEEYKSQISITMCVNIIDQTSIKSLPLDDADRVIVALGKHIGESILIISLLKKSGVKNIIARSINPIHRTILETIGVTDIINPDKFTADTWAYTSDSKKIKGTYLVSEDYQIIECEVPKILEGQTLPDADIEINFNLRIIAIKRPSSKPNFLGSPSNEYQVIEPKADFRFSSDDRIILYGTIKALENFKKQL